ncbi:hypothetical protein LSH36_474g00032 [Paralvinella palmiformis]|uniref:Uncharacterized protein n=1 Tax=Paralvinella palmiformis TaxID=53620 RepID=A0AAD9MX12_9ANNE|nr:hypothetical protein LSH36_474g00032 [Paralvinella palmiformis]
MSLVINRKVKGDDLSIKIPQTEALHESAKKKANTLSPSVRVISGRRDSRNGKDKPVELFRKDLISAMKLPDTEQLQQDEYLLITDPWRQDWESGVQVPVNPEETLNKQINLCEAKNIVTYKGFKFPKKYFHAMKDETYRPAIHELDNTPEEEEKVCRYDLDYLDVVWLERLNEERTYLGLPQILMGDMERIMNELETQCYNNMQKMIKTVEGLGIEYDENVVCDVCRSPDGEDSNEIVFCDGCDICVHQACYGIQKIPEGSWLCRTCALGIQPKCILCPKTGGAMKSTKSGTKWAHVSCALWIPEVSIGCPEKMEPIVKISHIPSSRWSLVCSVCRERSGACIQCSVKTCKTAFHVTCAFNNNLFMKTILDEEHDDVQLKAYCAKHSLRKDNDGVMRKEPCTPTKRENILLRDHSTPVKKESEMTEEERTELRSHRLAKLAEEFYSCVDMSEAAQGCHMNDNIVEPVFNYWVLKRKANFNKPLLMPKTEEADILLRQREDSLVAKMNMFIHLRQDLERVRNLCFMVSRREKIRRSLYAMKEEIFNHQVKLVDQMGENAAVGTRYWNFITCAHKQPQTIYDQHDSIIHIAHILDAVAEREAKEQSEDFASTSRTCPKVRKHGTRDGRRVNRAKRVLLPSAAGHKLQNQKSSDHEQMEVDVVKCEPNLPNSNLDESKPSATKTDSIGTPTNVEAENDLENGAKIQSNVFIKRVNNSLPSLRPPRRRRDEGSVSLTPTVNATSDSEESIQKTKISTCTEASSHSGLDKSQVKPSSTGKSNHYPKRLTRHSIIKDEVSTSTLQDKLLCSPEKARSCNASEYSDVENLASPSICSSDEVNTECQLSDANLRNVPSENGQLEDSTPELSIVSEDNHISSERYAFVNKDNSNSSPLLRCESPDMPDLHIEEDVMTDFSSHSPKKKLLKNKSNGVLHKGTDKLAIKDGLFSVEREKLGCDNKAGCTARLSENGTSLPQVEVSVDNSTGRIMLRVRNNTVSKGEVEESLDDQKDFKKVYRKPFGERKRSARIIQKRSLDSTLLDSKHNRLTPRHINGLVSPSEVVVAPDIKDKVYRKLRCNRNYNKNSERLESDLTGNGMVNTVCVKSGSTEITSTRTDTNILTKENDPANVIVRLHPAESDLMSSPKLRRRRKSRLSLSKSRHRNFNEPVGKRIQEVHAKRRKVESDLDISSQEGEYADVDALKSSRDTTPDDEHVHNTRNRGGNVLTNGLTSERLVSRSLPRLSNVNRTDSESDRTLTSALDSDSDYAPSDTSDFNEPQMKKRISKMWDSHDDTSRDSIPSIRSSSRLSQNLWPKFSSV